MTTLTDHQMQARTAVIDSIRGGNEVTYLAGYAGTGKSTILPHILEDLGYDPQKVGFCAPTGKAAKVMRSSLKRQGYPNSEAKTIHSAIYRAKPPPIATLEANIDDHSQKLAEMIQQIRAEAGAVDDFDQNVTVNLDKNPNVVTQRKLIERLEKELSLVYQEDRVDFSLNPDAPIQNMQLIVIDEASMVGARIKADLLTFGVPILAIGDPGQLPPIEDSAGLTAGIPDFFLKEIHRQAQDNPIIHLATLARQGKDLPYGDYGNGVHVLRRKDFDPNLSVENCPQFIVGMNKTRWRINQMLRADLGFIKKGEKAGPRKGEKLVVRKNSKDYGNLVNGTPCICMGDANIFDGDATFPLSFADDEDFQYVDLRVFQGLFEEHFSLKAGKHTANERSSFRAKKSAINMDWAFAITCHTAQGSQWPDVVVIDESDVFREEADRWLYTAITRAEKTLTVLR